MKNIVSIVSARPNFVKLAAVHHAISKHSDKIRHIIIHTGQHYDPLLSEIFFEQLKIPQPDYNLGVHGGTREEVIMKTDEALEKVFPEIHPDIILVYGDVNGAVGAARAAKKLGIKIGHIEAGLRSGDLDMPEELNRIEIDGIADHLFVTEKSGVDHLAEEKAKGEVHFVGNTMIDTLIRMKSEFESKSLGQRASQLGKFAIVTLHRPSNVDSREVLEKCLTFLGEIAMHIPILFPQHPRLMASLIDFGLELPKNVHSLGPMEYLNFLRHMQTASFILTDSGGIQEEATFLGKRCFTLRRNTERPSTIESGSNVLIDPENPADREKVLSYAKDPVPPHIVIPEKWDGKAGERIVECLLKL